MGAKWRFAILVVLAFGTALHFLSVTPGATNSAIHTVISEAPQTRASFALASLEPTAAIAPAPVGAPVAPPDKSKDAGAALSAAAIAALIVQASRQHYASGHRCACPDNTTRTGRRCGNTSAYSRPGAAAPLCYVTDVPAAMIEQYRSKVVAR
jgi:hypothetical protein